jgi:HAD superfamily phosphatase
MKATEPKASSKSANYAILFDMDGVLVDVTDSYRKAIQETVGFFTGKKAQPEEIQKLKEHGGYNNDWDLTEAILLGRGKTAPKTQIISKFQELYLGAEEKAGFIENEKWLLPKEIG